MKYNPPVGGASNDPYVDGNPGAGVDGSDVPAAAVEFAQREIVNAITAAALDPTNGDLTQLAQAIAILAAAAVKGAGQCQLQFVDGTHIKLVPKNGCTLPVAGLVHQVAAAGVTITNAGVTVGGVAGQNLAANTDYLVAYNAADGLEYWPLATGHQPDTTAGNVGVEIVTGHADKTIVGAVHTNSAAQFADGPTQRFVATWFNRREHALLVNHGTNSTSSLSFTPMNSSKAEFFAWGDDGDIAVSMAGYTFATTSLASTHWQPGLDGAAQGAEEGSMTDVLAYGQEGNAGGTWIIGGMAEGYHYLQGMFAVDSSQNGTSNCEIGTRVRI